jgi:hypothetical protein
MNNDLFAARERVTALEKALATADYLVDRYRILHVGGRVRDLDEAEVAYSRALLSAKGGET